MGQMLEDTLWTTIFSDEQIRIMMEHDELDMDAHKAIDTILGLLDIVD